VFQFQVVEQMAAACRAALDRYPTPEWRFAVGECYAFWLRRLAERQAAPGVELADDPWGKYVIIRTSHHPSSDEWTNIGCMVYDKTGGRVFEKFGPLDRATARGDARPHLPDFFPGAYTSRYTELADVERSLGSMGHAMSFIQMTEPRGCAIHDEVCWHLYTCDVLDIRSKE
jgi:hypothetical protein